MLLGSRDIPNLLFPKGTWHSKRWLMFWMGKEAFVSLRERSWCLFFFSCESSFLLCWMTCLFCTWQGSSVNGPVSEFSLSNSKRNLMLIVKGWRKGKLKKWLLVEILEKLRIPVKLECFLMHLVVEKNASKDAEGKQNCWQERSLGV